jgi:AcrR family transcriptional regulator
MADRVKPRRALTTARIVDEAMRMADTAGMEAISLRQLAARLGVTPMALYHYVRDKDELLDLMADRLVSEVQASDELSGSTWQEALRRIGERYLAVITAHPAAPFLLSRPFESPAARQVSKRILDILARAGFGPQTAVPLLQVSTGILLGPALHRAIYAAAARGRPIENAGTSMAGEPVDRSGSQVAAGGQSSWITGDEADRLTLELWLAAVEGLAKRRARSESAKVKQPQIG